MAAGQSRVAQAIRAIVLDIIKDKRDEGLTEQQKRDAILGNRGIGYMFPDGLNAGGVSGKAGITKLGEGLGNLSDYTTNEQLQHVLDAIENGPKSVSQALNMPLGSKAMAINGLMDCATGKAVEIVNTKEFKPPPGWTDPAIPPNEYERWTLGEMWFAPITPPVFGQTALGAAETAKNSQGSSAWTVLISSVYFPGPGFWQFKWLRPGEDPATAFPAVYQANRIACTPGSSTTCPTSYSVPWPTDNKMQLARGADGKFKQSPNEPGADVIPAFTDNQHSRLDLCFSDGSGRKATIEATHDGGWMIYERDPSTGASIGTATIYNPNNVVTAKMAASEDNLRAQRPTDLFI